MRVFASVTDQHLDAVIEAIWQELQEPPTPTLTLPASGEGKPEPHHPTLTLPASGEGKPQPTAPP